MARSLMFTQAIHEHVLSLPTEFHTPEMKMWVNSQNLPNLPLNVFPVDNSYSQVNLEAPELDQPDFDPEETTPEPEETTPEPEQTIFVPQQPVHSSSAPNLMSAWSSKIPVDAHYNIFVVDLEKKINTSLNDFTINIVSSPGNVSIDGLKMTYKIDKNELKKSNFIEYYLINAITGEKSVNGKIEISIITPTSNKIADISNFADKAYSAHKHIILVKDANDLLEDSHWTSILNSNSTGQVIPSVVEKFINNHNFDSKDPCATNAQNNYCKYQVGKPSPNNPDAVRYKADNFKLFLNRIVDSSFPESEVCSITAEAGSLDLLKNALSNNYCYYKAGDPAVRAEFCTDYKYASLNFYKSNELKPNFDWAYFNCAYEA